MALTNEMKIDFPAHKPRCIQCVPKAVPANVRDFTPNAEKGLVYAEDLRVYISGDLQGMHLAC